MTASNTVLNWRGVAQSASRSIPPLIDHDANAGLCYHCAGPRALVTSLSWCCGRVAASRYIIQPHICKAGRSAASQPTQVWWFGTQQWSVKRARYQRSICKWLGRQQPAVRSVAKLLADTVSTAAQPGRDAEENKCVVQHTTDWLCQRAMLHVSYSAITPFCTML